MKVYCKRESEEVDCETCDDTFVKMRAERDLSMTAHGIADRERQKAYDKIKELQAIVPAQDEDYRYRVEQIAGNLLSKSIDWENTSMDYEERQVACAIRVARKLVCAVEAMDRG